MPAELRPNWKRRKVATAPTLPKKKKENLIEDRLKVLEQKEKIDENPEKQAVHGSDSEEEKEEEVCECRLGALLAGSVQRFDIFRSLKLTKTTRWTMRMTTVTTISTMGKPSMKRTIIWTMVLFISCDRNKQFGIVANAFLFKSLISGNFTGVFPARL